MDFLGKGWKFPFNINYLGKVDISSYEADIKEAIFIILGTSPGERIMRPDFGCGIHEYVFSTMDTLSLSLIENAVIEALTRWEPRIELIEVKALPDLANDGRLLINIDYRIRTTNTSFNLVYPFYLKEGV
ncbi:MAG: GPW/gp25 family protein [Dehalobacter sp.]|nr:GPW/gp25 family protein [Dehalobacter sp.]